MADILLSYSSRHRDLTCALAEAIEAQFGAGSVWWDHALESWGDYELQIRNALNGARVVIVIWTKEAGESDWVKSEAGRANRDGKLVNVRPADLAWRDVPSPFDQHHFKNVEDTDGIMKSIASAWRGDLPRTVEPLHEIYFRHHGVRLIDPKRRPLPTDPKEISPTDLLQAKYEVVQYLPITGGKTELIDWCRSGRATAGRLVHGPGGIGKTRLMIEVAATLSREGWHAGFFDRPLNPSEPELMQRWQAFEQLVDHGGDAGLLIVIDYAETRRDEIKRIAEILARRAAGNTRSIRLILLSRGAGEWWDTLHDESIELQGVFRLDPVKADIIALAAISSGSGRRQLFRDSIAAFVPILTAQGYVAPGDLEPPERLNSLETSPGYARPLAVQMEALLHAASAAPEGASSVPILLQRVLGLERSHWRKLIGTVSDDEIRDMARGVAQATLVQGTPSATSSARLLLSDGFYEGQRTAPVHLDVVMRNLARTHGKHGGGLAHLEPDLIGEHHVAIIADSQMLDGCLQWIGTEPLEIQPKRRRDILTVLQRATQPEHGEMAEGAARLLDHLVLQQLQVLAADIVTVVVDTPGLLRDRLQHHVESLDEAGLDAINAALPSQSLALMDVSHRVAERLTALSRSTTDQEAHRGIWAWLLNFVVRRRGALDDRTVTKLGQRAARVGTLGNRLSSLGRREDALAATQEAVDIYRRLAQAHPDASLPDLAGSLNNLGLMFSNLGRREDALAATQEAVDIRRRLAQTHPAASLPDLAGSLNNLGSMFYNLGRREDALAATQEAVDIYRRLAEKRPDAFLPNVATSLSNLGNRLSNLGRREEALAAAQEAVDVRRRLAEKRPDAFLPDLATSINNLGNRLSDLGRREEALAATQEAVEIRGRLAQARPEAFLPDLATSLNNLGNRLSDHGRHAEALAATHQAVDIRRRLVQARPDAFLPDLAGSLTNLGAMFFSLGRLEEALAASQEAVDIHRSLAESHPEAFLPDLAMSLNNLGTMFSNVGRREDALAATQEAVDIRRRLAQARPDVFLPNLGKSLGALGQALAALDRHADATAATHEGLSTLAPFAERHPQAFGNLARALARDYLAACERCGLEPDAALLEHIARALEDESTSEDDATAALRKKIDAILKDAEQSGALDEATLAELPPEIADQLRKLSAERPTAGNRS